MNVIQLITNKVWGGGERYALDLCRALRADGHNVGVYTRRRPAVRDVFAAEGLLRGTLHPRGAFDFITPVRLASHLRALPEGPVVVHVHNFKDAYVALAARRLSGPRAADIRVVCTRHLVKAAGTSAHALRTMAELDAIIFVSELARREFLSSNPAGLDPARLHTVLNAIPRPDCAERLRLGPDDVPELLFAGRITPEKGLDTLLEALERIKDRPWHLTVLGTGTSRHVMPLLRLARETDIADRITWAGHVDDVRPYLNGADVAVQPSRARESFGLAILEAMWAGLPVVTTDNGAQPELIDNGRSGLTVPPDDPAALAAALADLIDDPGRRAAIARAAQATASTRFNYPRFYQSILDIYRGELKM